MEQHTYRKVACFILASLQLISEGNSERIIAEVILKSVQPFYGLLQWSFCLWSLQFWSKNKHSAINSNDMNSITDDDKAN